MLRKILNVVRFCSDKQNGLVVGVRKIKIYDRYIVIKYTVYFKGYKIKLMNV